MLARWPRALGMRESRSTLAQLRLTVFRDGEKRSSLRNSDGRLRVETATAGVARAIRDKSNLSRFRVSKSLSNVRERDKRGWSLIKVDHAVDFRKRIGKQLCCYSRKPALDTYWFEQLCLTATRHSWFGDFSFGRKGYRTLLTTLLRAVKRKFAIVNWQHMVRNVSTAELSTRVNMLHTAILFFYRPHKMHLEWLDISRLDHRLSCSDAGKKRCAKAIVTARASVRVEFP